MASAQCTGADNTTSTGANAGSGGASWTNPNSVQSSDGSAASVAALLSAFSIITTTSDYINVTNLGMNIPVANTICGVSVTINRQTFSLFALGASTVSDNSIRLIKGGSMVGTDHAATGVAWPTSLGTATYGSSSDLWGTTLTPADVNASNFGVAISTRLVAQILSVAFAAHVEQVTVTVYSQGILLPLELQNFTARRTQQGNTLTWSVAGPDPAGTGGDPAVTGANPLVTGPDPAAAGRVVVQRSSDGITGWQQLAVLDLSDPLNGSTIRGTNPTGGPVTQSYTDPNPLSSINFYRLCLISPAGTPSWSPVKAVAGKSGPVVTIHTYPNPFTDQINITSPVSFTRLILRDARGQVLCKKEYPAGVSNTSIPAVGLPAGIYFVQVDNNISQLIKN